MTLEKSLEREKIIKELQEKERDIKRTLAFQEFVAKGLFEKWRNAGLVFDIPNFIVKTPLNKNKNGVGLKVSHFEMLQANNKPLIIAIPKKESIKEHNFYVFHPNDERDTQFLMSKSLDGQFIFLNFRITKTETLRDIDRFVLDIKKDKQTFL